MKLPLPLFVSIVWVPFAGAAAPGPDIAAEATPLLAELSGPQYARSRCMLAPLLADDGRVVAQSADPAFVAGDRFVAVDSDVLNEASKTPLIEILEQHRADARVRVRVLRNQSERTLDVQCTDAKVYYSALREAAQRATEHDARDCADALDTAAGLHPLSSIWLRLSMACKIGAGRLSGNAIWRADYALFSQRILEAKSAPRVLDNIRHGVLSAVRDLEHSGNADLAAKLTRQYEDAIAAQPQRGSDG